MPSKSERAQLRAIKAELTATAEHVVRTVAAGVLDGVRDATPVDTGASAASWRANRAKVGPVVKRSKRAVAAAQGQQAQSKARLADYKLEQGKVHVGSSQPGIRGLAMGTSQKEPSGLVQRAIRKALTLARVRALVIRR